MASVAAAFTFSCLLIAASTSVAAEGHLQVLNEVVSGPARGRSLALHLDAILPEKVQRAVVNVEAVRRTPHHTLNTGISHSWRQVGAPSDSSLSSSTVLHVVLWAVPQTKLLQALWRWKPRNLLLFSLGASFGTDLLRHEALSGVEKVALIERLAAQANSRPNAFGVYTVLPFSGGVRFLGPWGREAFASWEALFPDRFPSFEGYTFHLATFLENPPFLFTDSSSPSIIGRGMMVNIMDCISAKLNFTYTFSLKPPDSHWGHFENGSWSGILGMIERKEKNFTINGLSITDDRVRDFDPSEPVWTESRRVFLPTPQPLPKWQSLMRPFTPTVWAVLLVVFISVVFFMHLGVETVCKGNRNSDQCVFGGSCRYVGAATVQPQVAVSHARSGASWLELLRALVCQSAPALSRALWQRVFFAVWLSCCLVITAAYTGNLTAIFTRPAYPRRMTSLQQLADSRIRIAMGDVGFATFSILQETKDPHLRRLNQRLDLFQSQRDAILAMSKGTHGMLSSETMQKFAILKTLKEHDWYIMDEVVNSVQLAWFFPKHTPWKSKFDQGIRQLSKFGLLRHWYKVETEEWLRIHPDLTHRGVFEGIDAAMPLSLQHLYGVFMILCLAWVAGGVLLLLELLTHGHIC